MPETYSFRTREILSLISPIRYSFNMLLSGAIRTKGGEVIQRQDVGNGQLDVAGRLRECLLKSERSSLARAAILQHPELLQETKFLISRHNQLTKAPDADKILLPGIAINAPRNQTYVAGMEQAIAEVESRLSTQITFNQEQPGQRRNAPWNAATHGSFEKFETQLENYLRLVRTPGLSARLIEEDDWKGREMAMHESRSAYKIPLKPETLDFSREENIRAVISTFAASPEHIAWLRIVLRLSERDAPLNSEQLEFLQIHLAAILEASFESPEEGLCLGDDKEMVQAFGEGIRTILSDEPSSRDALLVPNALNRAIIMRRVQEAFENMPSPQSDDMIKSGVEALSQSHITFFNCFNEGVLRLMASVGVLAYPPTQLADFESDVGITKNPRTEAFDECARYLLRVINDRYIKPTGVDVTLPPFSCKLLSPTVGLAS